MHFKLEKKPLKNILLLCVVSQTIKVTLPEES